VTTVAAVLTFTEERALFLREKQKYIYDTSTYFIGRTFVDMGLQTILAIIFGAFAYFMVGLQGDAGKFILYTICLIMVGQSTQSYALIVAAVVPYRTVALMLCPVVMVPFMMVTGFFVNNASIPNWLVWLQYISPQKFMFESLMSVEFNGLKLTCSNKELITIPLDDGKFELYCPLVQGSDIMKMFSLRPDRYGLNLLFVAILTVAVRVIAYFSLRLSAYFHIKNSGG